MIHAQCDVINIGNEVYFKPKEGHSINYNCLINREHITHDYHIGQIFDFRKDFINNCYTGKMHMYCIFYDENKNTPDLSNLEAVSTIGLYEREKIKEHGKKKLEYNNYSNNTFQTYPIRNKDTYLVYLGYAEDMNFREVAYETPGCFSSYISTTGNGYISINLVTSYSIGYKNAILLGFKNKIPENNDEIPEAIALDINDNIPVAEIEQMGSNLPMPIPTAPVYICEPSAPHIPT